MIDTVRAQKFCVQVTKWAKPRTEIEFAMADLVRQGVPCRILKRLQDGRYSVWRDALATDPDDLFEDTLRRFLGEVKDAQVLRVFDPKAENERLVASVK